MTTKPPAEFSPVLSQAEAVKLARLLKAFADPCRIQIIALLQKYEGTMTVAEIVSCFDLEQPTISHHLRILRDAGVIDVHKDGLFARYFVQREALVRAYNALYAI